VSSAICRTALLSGLRLPPVADFCSVRTQDAQLSAISLNARRDLDLIAIAYSLHSRLLFAETLTAFVSWRIARPISRYHDSATMDTIAIARQPEESGHLKSRRADTFRRAYCDHLPRFPNRSRRPAARPGCRPECTSRLPADHGERLWCEIGVQDRPRRFLSR
jgi:hypothetical protein